MKDGSQVLSPTAVIWWGAARGRCQDTVGEAIGGTDSGSRNVAGFPWLIQVLFQLAGIRDLGNDSGTAAINWKSRKGSEE